MSKGDGLTGMLSKYRFHKLKDVRPAKASTNGNDIVSKNVEICETDVLHATSETHSPWLRSVKPSQKTEDDKVEKVSKSSKRKLSSPNSVKMVPSRKRARCVLSSDDEEHYENVVVEGPVAEENGERSERINLSGSLDTNKTDISLLCLKFPLFQKPEIVRILKESNFNIESASLKLDSLQKSPPIKSHEGKNNLGSIKAFKANRMLVKMNNFAAGGSFPLNNSFESHKQEEETFKLKRLKRIKVVESDSDAEVKSEDEEKSKETDWNKSVLDFMSVASLDELTSLNGCSKKKAGCVVDMRPFHTWDDLITKLENNKHVGLWIVEKCKELLKVWDNVKQLMEKCQNISADLESSICDLMGGDGTHPGSGSKFHGYLTQQPSLLSSSLKLTPYQMVGLNWLIMMHSHNLNGILGDEMGLGKTIQTIAFLAYLLSQGNMGPHVIVSPSSTIDNWLRELQKWCPSIKVVPYYGSQEERRDLRSQLLDEGMHVNVILTSYNMASGSTEDKLLFKKYKYEYAIFDEGHMLKNMSSSRYKNLLRISAERRLLLTGTPLQNNLLELLSLLTFLMPDIFAGKTDNLKKIFSLAKSENPDAVAPEGNKGTYMQEILKQAKRILQPFFLRRLKADVLQQLPAKIEHTVKVGMTRTQQKLYDELKEQFRKAMREKNTLNSGASVMMQLRKAANHELLHRKNYDDNKLRRIAKKLHKDPGHRNSSEQYIYEDLQVMSDFEIHSLCKKYEQVVQKYCLSPGLICSSGKFKQLDDLLSRLDKGTKVLLFSQFTIMLDIIEVYMEERQYEYLRLDGSTPVVERQELIDQFCEDPDIFVFLLSTKAGGMGINLTAANVVILHDIDFNPYNDKQAEDRCHRVGQTREVTLYRLISKNTIEEQMLKCAREKLKLEREVTGSGAGDEMKSGDVAILLREALKIN